MTECLLVPLNGGDGGGVAGDRVEDETKWLYAAYMSNIFNEGENTALIVQQAIWWLEKEIGGLQSSYDTLKTYNFDNFGWTVKAVNLSSSATSTIDNQSQLVGVYSVPEPSLMLLIGTGMFGVVGIRQRREKN